MNIFLQAAAAVFTPSALFFMLVGTFFVIRNYLGGDEVSKLVVFTYFAPIVGFGIGIIRMIQNKIKGGKER